MLGLRKKPDVMKVLGDQEHWLKVARVGLEKKGKALLGHTWHRRNERFLEPSEIYRSAENRYLFSRGRAVTDVLTTVCII